MGENRLRDLIRRERHELRKRTGRERERERQTRHTKTIPQLQLSKEAQDGTVSDWFRMTDIVAYISSEGAESYRVL